VPDGRGHRLSGPNLDYLGKVDGGRGLALEGGRRRLAAAPDQGLGRTVLALVRHEAVRRALVVVLILRAGLGLVAWGSLELFPPTFEGGHWLELRLPPDAPLQPLVGPWQRWDALWYEHLATSGYRHHSIDAAFFPLYPALMRIVGRLLANQFALAGLLISTAALVVALALLHHLVAADLDAATARRTVLYLSLAPTSFFLLAPYTEALFLALSVAAFIGARRRMWPTAGVTAGLAALTRPTGLLLAVPLIVEAGTEALERHRSGKSPLRRVHLAVLLPVVASALYVLYAQVRLDTPQGPLGAQRAWNARFVAPWRAMYDSAGAVLDAERPEEAVNFLAAVLLVLAIPRMVKRMPWSYVAYAAAMALPVCSREAFVTPLMSSARFAVVVFPLFVVAAQEGRRRWVDCLIKSAGPVLMLLLFVAFVHYGFVG
jgi:hypothetical protein